MDKAAELEIRALKTFDPCVSGHKHAAKGRRNKTSHYRGVWKNKAGRYIAQIKDPGTKWSTHLGTFENEHDAALAYNIAALSIYGSDAFQNEIGS